MTFLRKTYAHLGGALIAFAIVTGLIMKFATSFSWGFSKWALKGQWNWIGVIVLFMICGYVAERLARSESSRGLQYAGLGLEVVAWSILLQPILWILMLKFSTYTPGQMAAIQQGGMTPVLNGAAAEILWQSVVVTLVIFIGLTLTVFLTKKDFSFLRGVLVIATFGALGVIIASALFGFSLGIIFVGFMILLMAGYILYQTSMVMRDFPPTAHVAAALMLFSTIATLFWYVLQLFMGSRD
ncbi:MAG: Bax inhibitor-1 family protein [Kofleriaceae bacterium]